MEDINKFIEKLEGEFDEVAKGTLTPQTSFKDIQGWSSMLALVLIALIDSEYNVLLNGEDLRQATTIQDVYDVVKSKGK